MAYTEVTTINKIDCGSSHGVIVFSNVRDLKLHFGATDSMILTAYNSQRWEEVRVERSKLLTDSDWTQGADSPLSTSKKTEWQTYRQSLRDLPTTGTDPDSITWPTPPS
tara:strand:- start:126 stop:452 length:327 start_codon:yes stop_codon:yes gene_type:complete